MKHLYKAYDGMSKNQQGFMGIHMLEDKAPLLGFKMKDGVIPGLQPADLLEFVKYLFESLYNETPRDEHKVTIGHLESALESQAGIVIPWKKGRTLPPGSGINQ